MEKPLDRYIQAAKEAGCPKDQVGNFLKAGAVLHPRQLKASAAARECDADGGPTQVGFGGARGGGKSHWLICQACIDDAQRAPGLKILILRKVGKANKENFEDIRLRVLRGVPHTYNRSEGVLIFANGSRVILGHFQNEGDIDAYLGLEYDIIGVEEATTLTASKVKAIRTCCRTSKKGWRPRMYFTTNPGNTGHAWFKQRFIVPQRTGSEKDTRFIQSTVSDNPAVNKEYRETLETLTGWQREAWLNGSWDVAAGQYFTEFSFTKHTRPASDLQAIPGAKFYLALDYGYTHFTVAHLLMVYEGQRILLGEYKARRTPVETNAAGVLKMLEEFGLSFADLEKAVAGRDIFAKGRLGRAKAGEDERSIAEQYEEFGLKFEPANDDRVNGAGEILQRLGDEVNGIPSSLIISQQCELLLDQLPAMEHNPHRPEDVLKVDCDEDGIGGDDAYDAFRYVMMAAHSGRGWTKNLDELKEMFAA